MPRTRRRTSRSEDAGLRAAIEAEMKASIEVKLLLFEHHRADLLRGVRVWHATLSRGGRILFCGNGGSAADCQHIAAELVVRLAKKRRALPAVALTTDTSVLTAAANDLGYEQVFARQLEALGRKGDLLVALSTSGRSQSVLLAARRARALGLAVMALTGWPPNPLTRLADCVLAAPSTDTRRIQEAHVMMLHILAGQTERLLFR